jgi:TetR/AcrR family transcriptional regulator, copper-responsive repressor
MVQKKEDAAPKRRGRPRAYDPKIALARAADTFWKAGYAGTSLDDLAAATGMNRPSLYAAFGDKRELYLKTLEHYRDEYRALARRTLADDPTLRVFLKRFYDAALDLYLAGEGGARGCYSIGTAATEATVDPNVRAFLADSTRNTDAFLKSRIDKARERGEIAQGSDTTALAYLATATMHTIAIRSRAGLARRELDAIVDAAIDVICG